VGAFVESAAFGHVLSALALSAVANAQHPHVTLWHSKRDPTSSFAALCVSAASSRIVFL
jgi:hypothetical protein